MGISKRTAEVKTVVAEKTRPKAKRPSMYEVFLVNDDYTPMDFVVAVIMEFFELSEFVATKIMLQVHTQGRGSCGIFTKDVAETKVTLVNNFSRAHDQPLLCQMQKVH